MPVYAGVVSEAGSCCEAVQGRPVTLDREGRCCSGRLDACGVCNGLGAAVDLTGACCAGRLDAGATFLDHSDPTTEHGTHQGPLDLHCIFHWLI